MPSAVVVERELRAARADREDRLGQRFQRPQGCLLGQLQHDAVRRYVHTLQEVAHIFPRVLDITQGVRAVVQE